MLFKKKSPVCNADCGFLDARLSPRDRARIPNRNATFIHFGDMKKPICGADCGLASKASSQLTAATHNRHNGNIGTMVCAFNKNSTAIKTIGNSFVYDQPYRLFESKTFVNLKSSTNSWPSGTTYNGMFENNFTCDASGNILTHLRKNESGVTTDQLYYRCIKYTRGTAYSQQALPRER